MLLLCYVPRSLIVETVYYYDDNDTDCYLLLLNASISVHCASNYNYYTSIM